MNQRLQGILSFLVIGLFLLVVIAGNILMTGDVKGYSNWVTAGLSGNLAPFPEDNEYLPFQMEIAKKWEGSSLGKWEEKFGITGDQYMHLISPSEDLYFALKGADTKLIAAQRQMMLDAYIGMNEGSIPRPTHIDPLHYYIVKLVGEEMRCSGLFVSADVEYVRILTAEHCKFGGGIIEVSNANGSITFSSDIVNTQKYQSTYVLLGNDQEPDGPVLLTLRNTQNLQQFNILGYIQAGVPQAGENLAYCGFPAFLNGGEILFCDQGESRGVVDEGGILWVDNASGGEALSGGVVINMGGKIVGIFAKMKAISPTGEIKEEVGILPFISVSP